MQDDVKSLSHSKWRCKYHIVFAPKYRRQVIYGKIKADVGKILRDLCQRKGVEILEAECCPDHIHMLVTVSGGQNNHSKGGEKRPILGKLRNQQLSSLNLFFQIDSLNVANFV